MQLSQYTKQIMECLQNLSVEESTIEVAVSILVQATRENRLIHIFGTEPHCARLEGEIFFNNNSLINVNPIYDPSIDLSHGGYRCSLCQSLEGLSGNILSYYENIRQGDPIIILTDATDRLIYREAISWARAKELKVITIVAKSSETDRSEDSNILINAHAIAANDRKTKTICISAVLNIMLEKTLSELKSPLLWKSDYMDGARNNFEEINLFIERIKHL